ncbi:hypothetical protein BSKO_11579 [Bryopsis sp. KO-2023]|nr:hypothetical protein BSKO_11579 [Bryopsis sp. KO-2023]
MRTRTRQRFSPRVLGLCAICLVLFILVFFPSGRNSGAAASQPKFFRVLARSSQEQCVVNATILSPTVYDAPEMSTKIPSRVWDFKKYDAFLPKIPASELVLVSMTSNNTYHRTIAQRNTFGKILDLRVVTETDWEHCILCDEPHFDVNCHCPKFRRGCDVFWDKGYGWWCANKKNTRALQKTLHEIGLENLPKWLHMIDDDTWINPITEILLINSLDSEEEWYLGDDWGAFGGGGPGHLISRAALRRLLGPPVVPNPVFKWLNGTWAKPTTTTQIDSCYEKVQGGEWCYYHSDWAISACLYDLDIKLTDIGGYKHTSLFSQFHQHETKNPWFGISKKIALSTHNAIGISFHTNVTWMLDTFEHDIVPFYKMMKGGYDQQADQQADQQVDQQVDQQADQQAD